MSVADEIRSRVKADVVGAYTAVLGAATFTKKGGEFYAACPFHEDGRPSFRVSHEGAWFCDPCGQGGDLFQLYALRHGLSCKADFVRVSSELGRLLGVNESAERIVAKYDYKDESGALLFQKLRYEPKTFKVRRSDGSGGWIYDVKGVRRVLYRLPELVAADPAAWVWVLEGEKDVDRMAAREFVATSSPFGGSKTPSTKKWPADFNQFFAGRKVAIVPDNDETGREFSDYIAAELLPVVTEVRIVRLPPDCKDAWDFFEKVHTGEELVELLERAPKETELRQQYRKNSAGAAAQATAAPVTATARKQSQADLLIEIALNPAARIDLFHDREIAMASFIDKAGSTVTAGVRTGRFRAHLLHLFYSKHRKAVGSQAMQDAIGLLEAQAIEEGEHRKTYFRVADLDDRVAIDLGDESGVTVVTASGWTIEKAPPVPLVRVKTMLPLAPPVAGGSVDELREFVNFGNGADGDDRFRLAIGWLLAALSGRKPFPILELFGEQDAGKSTVARTMKALVDPGRATDRGQPKDLRDLAVAAMNNYVLSYDNLSSLPLWLSDAFCRLATGAGFGTRKLYLDDEEKVFDDCRPLIINGIEEVGEQSDLVDRVFALELPPLDAGRDEAELLAAFQKSRGRIFGSLLTALAHGIANRARVTITEKVRMRDAARLVTAAEPALGWQAGSFLTTYVANRKTAKIAVLEASAFAQIVLGLVPFEGTASQLLAKVLDGAGDDRDLRKKLPSTPTHLSGALRKIAPNLRTVGLKVSRGTGRERRIITITLEQTGNSASPASPTEKTPDLSGDFGDAHGDAHGDGDARDGGDAQSALFSNSAGDIPSSPKEGPPEGDL